MRKDSKNYKNGAFRNSKKENKFRVKSGNKQGKQTSTGAAPFIDDAKGDRQQRRAEEAFDTIAKLSRDNPVDFYTKFKQFAQDASRFPFASPLGTPFIVDNATNGKFSVPGVMRITYSPAIGISRDYTSAINRSSTRFYTYLRSNQKASANYDHQDITMMMLSLDQAYTFHALCRRIYGVMQNVTPLNEYYARTIVGAMGAKYNDIRQNLADFRNWINTYAYNLGQYAMPKGITLFDRHQWMCEGYYVDSNTTRAQTYVFVPLGFWTYDNTVTTGSQLTFKYYLSSNPLAVTQYTAQQLMDFGDSLLNAIAGEEDFQYISGDIYNFYGGDQFQLPYVDENYTVLPSFSKVVLSQIENATIMGPFASDPVISQQPNVNDGAIIYDPEFTFNTNAEARENMFMNFHWESPTPDDVIEATRLMPVPGSTENNTVQKLQQCGTEIVHRLDIFAIDPTSLAARSNPINRSLLQANATNPWSSIVLDLLLIAQFDWAPGLRVYDQLTDPTVKKFLGFTWDIDVFGRVIDSYVSTVHDACLYSLFEVGTNRVTLE